VPVGLINSVAEALQEPQLEHRDMLVNLPHPLNAEFQMIGSPIKLSETPVEYHHAPPQLGEHTMSVLSEFKAEHELLQLKAMGIIDSKIA
jgi:crotonobetainyl-CoA:carnitine CoA-transferase CaiB-like acyl-CoA transferase